MTSFLFLLVAGVFMRNDVVAVLRRINAILIATNAASVITKTDRVSL